MDAPLVRIVAARTHGRYLVRPSTELGPAAWLVGFHGYGQHAEQQLQALEQLPGSERWMLVAPQGLHRFYHRGQRVVASWMTREDRELAIADNVAYIGAVLEALRHEYGSPARTVFAGFSQGVAMAYRAAAAFPAAAVIALAGDLPPDVAAHTRVRLPEVLIGAGLHDPLYTVEQQGADAATLARLGVTCSTCTFDGGHEWTEDFRAAAGVLLARIADQSV